MSSGKLCLNCFRIKGDYEVCPYCGYVEGAQPDSVYQLKPGTVLRNRYIIGQSIGLGGFGITYRAFDINLGIVVAVKEFYPAGLVNRAAGETKVGVFSGDKSEQYKKQLERFLMEARNMAAFARAADVVNVFDYFEDNGTAYIIMEYIDGILLKEYLRAKGRLSLEEACSYMIPMLEALQRIHDHGIIHRDISPDNIFLMGMGRVKIFDFGAAQFQNQVDEAMPIVIKTGYAPPEQYRIKGRLGPQTDIYAIGAVFYEMLTGEKPVEALDRMELDDLKMPSQMGVLMDEAIERALAKSLSLAFGDRFGKASEFRAAILKEA